MSGRISTPSISVTLNGDLVDGLLQAHIYSTNAYSADTFSLTFATGHGPLLSTANWASLAQAYVEVRAANSPGSDRTLLISGFADIMNIDPLAGTVGLEGRDLSASMIDGYRQQNFMNQTASEIVTSIATAHGLVPVVTATQPNVGRFYSSDFTQLSLAQHSRFRSDWDLVVQLARENQFDVFVSGSQLFFQPSSSFGSVPYVLGLGDVTAVQVQVMLALPDAPVVTIQSWSSQMATTYSSNECDSGTVAAPAVGSASQYLFSQPNLTFQQVDQAAQRYVAEVTRLKTVLSVGMAWNFDLAPRMLLELDMHDFGLGAQYQIESIHRQYNTVRGSTQHVRASLVQP